MDEADGGTKNSFGFHPSSDKETSRLGADWAKQGTMRRINRVLIDAMRQNNAVTLAASVGLSQW
jgi:hypothetical protein